MSKNDKIDVFGSMWGGNRLEHNYIKDYRLLLGIKSTAALARMAGVSRSTLGELENNKTPGNPEILDKIARSLGLERREELYKRPTLFIILLCISIEDIL